MEIVDRVKLMVHESVDDGYLGADDAKDLLDFCEYANIDDPDDAELLTDICEYCADLAEANAEEHTEGAQEPMTTDEVALLIYESCSNGEISEVEKDVLLEALNDR